MLPGFTNEGYLPPADYELTLDELRDSMLVAGPSNDYPNWDQLEFPSAFRLSRRDGEPRSIIKIIKGGQP